MCISLKYQLWAVSLKKDHNTHFSWMTPVCQRTGKTPETAFNSPSLCFRLEPGGEPSVMTSLQGRLFSCVHLIQAVQPGTALATWLSDWHAVLANTLGIWTESQRASSVADTHTSSVHQRWPHLSYDVSKDYTIVFNEQTIGSLVTFCSILDQTSILVHYIIVLLWRGIKWVFLCPKA